VEVPTRDAAGQTQTGLALDAPIAADAQWSHDAERSRGRPRHDIVRSVDPDVSSVGRLLRAPHEGRPPERLTSLHGPRVRTWIAAAVRLAGVHGADAAWRDRGSH
jgi:hypothetical protein